MSVPTEFLAKFCQAPPKPKPISEQDIIDDFVNTIEKVVSDSTSNTSNTSNASNTSNDVLVRYEFPEKFTQFVAKNEMIKIILKVVQNQMGFTECRNIIVFNHDVWRMPHKTYYFEKKETSYQYNEEYIHFDQCTVRDNPDSIFLKLYVPH
jgi:hypothetical protein